MFILLSLITKKDSKNIYRWQFLLFLIVLETILEYFLLIERNIAFVLKLLNFGENGCMFLDTSFTKVILSITLLFKWLSRSKRCSSLALDLLFCLEGVLLLMRNRLCVIERWPSQSKIDGCGFRQPVPKWRWKFSQCFSYHHYPNIQPTCWVETLKLGSHSSFQGKLQIYLPLLSVVLSEGFCKDLNEKTP